MSRPDEQEGQQGQPAPHPAPPVGAALVPAEAITPALLTQLVENQAKELAIRSEEVRLREREIDAAAAFSEKALEAQAADRKDDRIARKTARRDRLIASGLAVLALLAFIVYLLSTGKDAFASEVLKAIVYLAAGGSTGFIAGKRQSPRTTEERAES
jgi:hypothetical protein